MVSYVLFVSILFVTWTQNTFFSALILFKNLFWKKQKAEILSFGKKNKRWKIVSFKNITKVKETRRKNLMSKVHINLTLCLAIQQKICIFIKIISHKSSFLVSSDNFCCDFTFHLFVLFSITFSLIWIVFLTNFL